MSTDAFERPVVLDGRAVCEQPDEEPRARPLFHDYLPDSAPEQAVEALAALHSLGQALGAGRGVSADRVDDLNALMLFAMRNRLLGFGVTTTDVIPGSTTVQLEITYHQTSRGLPVERQLNWLAEELGIADVEAIRPELGILRPPRAFFTESGRRPYRLIERALVKIQRCLADDETRAALEDWAARTFPT